jgi:tetratricopeptide (TPR) repeat protein
MLKHKRRSIQVKFIILFVGIIIFASLFFFYFKAYNARTANELFENALGESFKIGNSSKSVFQKYQEASKLGDARAQYNLAHIYFNHRNDLNNAIKWYEKALAQKKYIAAINLGHAYMRSGNIDKAIQTYEIGAQAGVVQCMVNLANYHSLKGQFDQALIWMEILASKPEQTIIMNDPSLSKVPIHYINKVRKMYQHNAKRLYKIYISQDKSDQAAALKIRFREYGLRF